MYTAGTAIDWDETERFRLQVQYGQATGYADTFPHDHRIELTSEQVAELQSKGIVNIWQDGNRYCLVAER